MKKILPPRQFVGLPLAGIALLFGITGLIPSGYAAPLPQLTPFPTPTPGPDGRILYTVQSGDTLWRVAAVSGMTVDEVRALNGLGPEDIIVQGQVLLLGIGGPAIYTPTPGPTPTPRPVTPTVTPKANVAALCVLLYEDINGDALRQSTEEVIPGGAISIADCSGKTSLTAQSGENIGEICNFTPFTGFNLALGFTTFTNIPPGQYNVSIAVPEGYHPTTLMDYTIRLKPGDEAYLSFGAQQDEPVASSSPAEVLVPEENTSPELAILGGVLLLAGILLAAFANRLGR